MTEQENRARFCAKTGRIATSATVEYQSFLWGMEYGAQVERERCYEMAADTQLYPSDPDCGVLNPVVQKIMRRIESGTTLDDLRSNAELCGGTSATNAVLNGET